VSLQNTDADKGVMHESFNPNRPAQFTRPWFAWANSLFAELVRDKLPVLLLDATNQSLTHHT
jgi:meiotically up-regulated gene 157 (Mug157) protein